MSSPTILARVSKTPTSLQRVAPMLPVLFLALVCLVGCSSKPTAPTTNNAMPAANAVAPPKPVTNVVATGHPDEYRVLDPNEVGFEITFEVVKKLGGYTISSTCDPMENEGLLHSDADRVDKVWIVALHGHSYPVKLRSTTLRDHKLIRTTKFGDIQLYKDDATQQVLMTDAQVKQIQDFLKSKNRSAKH